MLLGNNYADRKDKILLALGYIDLDAAFHVDEPPIPMISITQNERATYGRWKQSNHLSLILNEPYVSKSIKGSIPKYNKVRDYMKAIEKQFISSDILMKKFSSITHDKSRSMWQHIIEIRDIATQLRFLEVEIFRSFLVYFIFNSLPLEYDGWFKMFYNICKKKMVN